VSPFRCVQKSRGKNAATGGTTADKAEGTTEDSETTGGTTADKAEGTTEGSETTGETTADKVDGATEGSEPIEVDKGNSVAPSTTTIGRARSATT
jgi:hypothetical protein